MTCKQIEDTLRCILGITGMVCLVGLLSYFIYSDPMGVLVVAGFIVFVVTMIVFFGWMSGEFSLCKDERDD